MRRRLANRDDVATYRYHHHGTGDLRDPPDPGRVLLRVEDQTGQQTREAGDPLGAVRCAAIAAHVLPALPHLQGHAVAQQAVYGRVVPQHRCPEPDKLQHEIRAENAHDHMPGHGTARVYGVLVDNRQLDTQTMRKVTKWLIGGSSWVQVRRHNRASETNRGEQRIEVESTRQREIEEVLRDSAVQRKPMITFIRLS